MIVRRQRLGADEVIRQRRVRPEAGAESAQRVIFHRLFDVGAVRLQHLARIRVREHRLDAARHIAGEQGNGAGRRDRGEQRIAHAVPRNAVANRLRQAPDVRPRQILVRVEQRKRAFFFRDLHRRRIGRPVEARKPALDEPQAFRRAVARAAEDERIGEAGDAQPDAPLRHRFGALLRQRKARNIDDVVEKPHGRAGEPLQFGFVQFRILLERVLHQAREIDRAQQTRAVRRQRLLATRVGRADGFAVGEVVLRIDAVDEDDARFGGLVGRAHDTVPQPARAHGPKHPALKLQRPFGVVLHRGHKGIARQHREVEHGKAAGRALGVDEGFDVRVVAGESRHHRAAARAGAHDGAAHGVPHLHERHRAGGIRTHAVHFRTTRPQGGKIVADAAALLQRQRRFAQVREDPVHGIRNGAHHEAVEERHVPLGASAGENSACWEKAVSGHCTGEVERPFPTPIGGFGGGRGHRHAGERIFRLAIDGRAVGRFQPVFHVPDLAGNIAHRASFRPRASGCES